MKGSSLILLIIFSLIYCSCKRSVADDSSLELLEYQQLGMPDPNRVWSFKDHAAAYDVLVKMKMRKPFALPQKESNKSGVIFDRIISLNNLTFLEDESLPLHEKANALKEYLNAYWEGIDIYTNIRMKNQYYHRELLGLHIFGLSLAQKMLDLSYGINESTDPSDINMQSGYRSIQAIYVSILVDLLKTQKHTSQYLQKDLELLSDSISTSVSRNRSWMTDTDVHDVNLALNVVIDSTSSSYIKNKYIKLIAL